MPERVGFIGLGIMGRGMAANLLDAGHDLIVHNRTAERMRPLAERGAATADSPRELAMAADVIITCVSDTPDVDHVLFGPDGVADGVRPGSLIVDMSTVSPAATRFFATRLADKEVGYLDAPVSGGSEGAVNGTLNIMVGGDDAALTRVRPYLDAMGSKITHVGPVGAGQTCKLVNQILVVVTMLGVSEGLLLAEAGGLDLRKTVEAVSGGAAGSWMLDNRAPQVIERHWDPGFTVDLQQKDLRLVLETADAAGVPLVGTSLVSQLYRTLQRAGEGGDGNHALVKALERLSGVTVGERPAGAAATPETGAGAASAGTADPAAGAAAGMTGDPAASVPGESATDAVEPAPRPAAGPAAEPATDPGDPAPRTGPYMPGGSTTDAAADPVSTPPLDPGLPPVDPLSPPVGPAASPSDPLTPSTGPATPPTGLPTVSTDLPIPPVRPAAPPVDPVTPPPDPAEDVLEGIPLAPGTRPDTGPLQDLGHGRTPGPLPEVGGDLAGRSPGTHAGRTPSPPPGPATDLTPGPLPELGSDLGTGPTAGPGHGHGGDLGRDLGPHVDPGPVYPPRPPNDPDIRPAPETGSGTT
jgi:2-hydroxy-3-oxopropionate reductase